MNTRVHRGSAMLELMMSATLSLLIGAMLLMFVRVDMVARQMAQDQANNELSAWRPMHRLADNLRKAYPYGTGGATLFAATASSVTIYTDSAGDTTRYWLDATQSPPVLNQTKGNVTQMEANGLQTLTFTYYLATGNTMAQGACWATTASPHAPTSTEMPNIVAIGITITTTVDGGTSTLTTAVRLRNGPRTVSGQ